MFRFNGREIVMLLGHGSQAKNSNYGNTGKGEEFHKVMMLERNFGLMGRRVHP